MNILLVIIMISLMNITSILGNSFIDIDKSYDSPRQICKVVERNIRYYTEKKDSWATPEATWNNGKGDCEDFAVLIKYLCDKSNMKSDIYVFYTPSNVGHAILLGEYNNRYWMASNGKYYDFPSQEERNKKIGFILESKYSKLTSIKVSDATLNNLLAKN